MLRTPLKTAVLAAMIAVLPAVSHAETASVAITDPGHRSVRNNKERGDYQGVIGYDLLIGTADVQVTHLGVWDGPGNQNDRDSGQAGDGLEQSAVVGIYRVSDQKLVAEATVPAGQEGELQGEFRYVALEKPVTLKANDVYRVATGIDEGGNAFRNNSGGRSGPIVSEHFMAGKISFHNPDGSHDKLIFPTHHRFGSIYIGASFRYTGGAAPRIKATEKPGDRLAGVESQPGKLVLAEDFEDMADDTLPAGWTFEPAKGANVRSINVEAYGAGHAGHALKIEANPVMDRVAAFGGLTYRLPEAADRVALAFDFKVDARRRLEVFTIGEDDHEPSQLRMRMLQDRISLYGGLQLGWTEIRLKAFDKKESIFTSPWYRIKLVIDRQSDGIDVYLSEPNSPDVSDKPVMTLPIYGSQGQAIEALRFSSPWRNVSWIDNVTIHTGDDIPAPGKSPKQPDLSEGYQLWTGKTFPRSFGEIEHPKGIEHHIIAPYIRPWNWYHGTAIEYHKGKLYASWAANDAGENQPGEVVLVAQSTDGGKTWSEPKILAPGDGKNGVEYSNSHGTLLSHQGKLWGFYQHWAGGWDNPLSTEAFVLNEKTGEWESQGIVATQGWPLDRPKKSADGNWIMGVSGFKMRRPGVMISHGDDLTKWDTIAIPTEHTGMFTETSVIVDGNDVVSITRWGGGRPLCSISHDGGRTWVQAERANVPAGSKPDSGMLSTGQWFAILNIDTRDALIIAVGKPGEKGLSKMYKVRYGSPPSEFPYEGDTRAQAYAYPYAMEHDGKLYVTYSVNKGNCEVAIIPIESLKAE